MGKHSQRDTPATNGNASITRTTSITRSSGADEGKGTADLIYVCRSAMLRRAEYQVYRELLLAFLATGGPPDRPTLRTLARRYNVPLEAALARMAQQDLVQRDPATGVIRAAYPFSGVPTPHLVTLLSNPSESADGSDITPVQLYAMCALDALGIPLMLRRDALVTSADAITGEAIRVTVRQARAAEVSPDAKGDASGLDGWRAIWEPSTAVVFARPEEHECEGGVAAGSCCPITNFFVTKEQAEQWAEGHGSAEDVVLTQDEALHRARSLFAGVLERLDEVDPVDQPVNQMEEPMVQLPEHRQEE